MLVLLLGESCKKDKYENCCPNSSTEFTVGNGKVYVPNIFTPNGDGVNDVFQVFGDTNVQAYKNIKIKNGKGDVIFELEEVQNIGAFNPVWTPTSYEGNFSYSFIAASKDGTEVAISGSACSYTYQSGNPPEGFDCTKCRFATQHDGAGGFCDSCPFFESICQ